MGEQRLFVYLIQAEETGIYKIGQTRDFRSRFTSLQNSGPLQLKLEILMEPPGIPLFNLETILHHRYREYRIHGEWFDFHDGRDPYSDIMQNYKEYVVNPDRLESYLASWRLSDSILSYDLRAMEEEWVAR